MTKDQITNSVIEDLIERSKVGYIKYNTTLHQNNKDNYLRHLYEELLDAAQYIKKLLSQNENITDLVKKHGNDADLGAEIRRIFNNIN